MDFFRRVFKSDSKTELQTPPGGSDSDGSLFGGLDVNETEPSLEDTPERPTSPTLQPSTERYKLGLDINSCLLRALLTISSLSMLQWCFYI
jgi:hypothetical protein